MKALAFLVPSNKTGTNTVMSYVYATNMLDAAVSLFKLRPYLKASQVQFYGLT
jgi:hypothetical protein